MATAKIKDLNPVGATACGGSLYEEFKGLLLNAVKVERTDDETLDYATHRFIKNVLIEHNAVGYDKLTDRFYLVYGSGVNDYGNPITLQFRTANGKGFTRKASYDDADDGAYILCALPSAISFAEIIRRSTDYMGECTNAMFQNLEACKTPYIVVCKNKDLQSSFELAIKQKQRGQAVLLVNEDLGEGLKAVNISTAYLVDKFRQERDLERDYLFNKTGIMSANTSKRERVQSAEVNATLGQATDYIYMFIDNFNNQCETYGLPYKMSLNGALEEIYLKDDGEAVNDVDVNDAEREQK